MSEGHIPDQLGIRSLSTGDLQALLSFDPSYHTEHVWQMEFDRQDDQVKVFFKDVRLPRSMRVEYPRPIQQLIDDWDQDNFGMAVSGGGEIVAFLAGRPTVHGAGVMITDLVVLRRLRRQGVGTRLLLATETWARTHKLRQIVLAMQSKNFPAIQLAAKLGYEFCGFSDRHYENQDIALFFGKRV
jgi:GNAT superfamily N-acetyltransferase